MPTEWHECECMDEHHHVDGRISYSDCKREGFPLLAALDGSPVWFCVKHYYEWSIYANHQTN